MSLSTSLPALSISTAPPTQRQKFLLCLFPQVKRLRYALMNYQYTSLADIPAEAEFELLMDRKELENWKHILNEAEGLRKLRYRETSFACYVELSFEDGGNLNLVLFHQLKKNSYVFLAAKPILVQVNRNAEGVWLAAPEQAMEYMMLACFLSGAPVPQAYLAYFSQQNKVIQASVRRYFLNEYQLDVQQIHWDSPEDYHQKLWKMVKKNKANRSWRGVKLLLNYLADLWEEPTLVIPFSGTGEGEQASWLAHIPRLFRARYRQKLNRLRSRQER